jgi:DNA-binding response OmpR family regulator
VDTVLIIEDEPTLARGLRDAFEHHGFAVVTAADGEAGFELAVTGRPSLVILDLMLPKKSGTDVCRDLRGRNIHTPIIMLTARSEESDRVGGFDVGADDYVTKPFSIRELVARARAVLRRGAPTASPARVVVAASVPRASRRGDYPGAAAQRDLGLPGVSDDENRGYVHAAAAAEDRAGPAKAGALSHGLWRRLQVRAVKAFTEL